MEAYADQYNTSLMTASLTGLCQGNGTAQLTELELFSHSIIVQYAVHGWMIPYYSSPGESLMRAAD